MNESCCYQNSCAEVLAGKEYRSWDLEPAELLGSNGESGSCMCLLVGFSL